MPKEEKMVQDETPEEAPKPKSKTPMLLIIIAAGVFVVGIGVFSVVMGVFSSLPTAESVAPPDSLSETTAAAVADSAGKDLSELEKLEKEIFGDKPPIKADDLDDMMGQADTEESDTSTEDSLAALNWIETEKAKLAAERTDLNRMKKQIETREYQLKQVISQVNQLQSDRIGSLAKLYDGMKPAQVAPLINKLTDEQAVQVLLKMKPANAAKILGVLNPDRAATISANMITLNEEN